MTLFENGLLHRARFFLLRDETKAISFIIYGAITKKHF